MTYNEFKAIASLNGIVKWGFSGIFERLYVGCSGDILAEGPSTRCHAIRKQRAYSCEEVKPDDLVLLGEVLNPSFIPFNLRRN